MKKYLIIIICTLVLLVSIFTITKTDTYAKTESTSETEIVDNKKENNTVKNEEENVEQEEIETESYENIETSTSDEYEESYDYSDNTESYYTGYGTYGRLYIYDYSAALYDYNVNTYSDYSLQSIVDDADSAAYYRNKGKLVIADHNYQGFNVLTYLSEGDYAYIEFEDGSTIGYRLIRKSYGYNNGPDLVDTEGNSFFYMDSDIIMYTCCDDGIMATLWVLA